MRFQPFLALYTSLEQRKKQRFTYSWFFLKNIQPSAVIHYFVKDKANICFLTRYFKKFQIKHCINW